MHSVVIACVNIFVLYVNFHFNHVNIRRAEKWVSEENLGALIKCENMEEH